MAFKTFYNVFAGVTGRAQQTKKRKATILSDYNLCTTTPTDSLFHFVDCSQVSMHKLAKDIRAGIIEIKHTRVVIALGNLAALDSYTNVASPTVAVINALVERYGCTSVKIFVLGVLPRPGIDYDQEQVLKVQNKALGKAVRALIRKKQYPVTYVAAYKWLLRRLVRANDVIDIQPDPMYFYPGTPHLNSDGLNHMYLLLAKFMQLRMDIQYEWSGMPIVQAKQKRRVLQDVWPGNSSNNNRSARKEKSGKKSSPGMRVARGAHIRRRGAKVSASVTQAPVATEPEVQEVASDTEEQAPQLVHIPGL